VHKDLARLDEFILSLPKREHAVFEFRHSSWYDQETFDLMHRRGVALCVLTGDKVRHDGAGYLAYVRFHGTTKLRRQ
jgi:uncharacterized protein YecE (DUF72 family)